MVSGQIVFALSIVLIVLTIPLCFLCFKCPDWCRLYFQALEEDRAEAGLCAQPHINVQQHNTLTGLAARSSTQDVSTYESEITQLGVPVSIESLEGGIPIADPVPGRENNPDIPSI